MTIDEAIKHTEEVVEEKDKEAYMWEYDYDGNIPDTIAECKKCAEEHRQLAEWLKELKHLREQESKIKVLDDMEAAKRLGMVDVYSASAWLEFIKDLKILGLRVCEVTESEVQDADSN